MKFTQFTAARADTGAVLPYATATVYLTGTSTKAQIYDANNAAITNPATADGTGLVSFKIADGVYDIQVISSDGSYSVPRMQQVQIYDSQVLAQTLTSMAGAIAAGTLGGVITVKKDTRANLNADLAYAAGTIALVYADATASNNDLYVKSGASGSGSWSLTGLINGPAAAVQARLNEYQVAFYTGKPVVDPSAGKVRYGRMLVMRNGAGWTDLNPSTQAGGVSGRFELTYEGDTSLLVFHYIDFTKIGTASNPVLEISSAGVPDLTDPNMIPLGWSFAGMYFCFWSDAIRYDTPSRAEVVFVNSPIDDRVNALGGGSAVYLPRSNVYIRAAESQFNSSGGFVTVTNADAGGNMAGYCKLTVPAGYVGTLVWVVYDIDNGQFKIMNYPTYPGQPGGGATGYRYVVIGILLGSWSVFSPTGVRWISQAKPAKSDIMMQGPLVVDSSYGNFDLLIPPFYYRDQEDTGYSGSTIYTPADGSNYHRLAVQTNNGVVRHHMFDKKSIDGGGTFLAAFYNRDGNAVPSADGPGQVVIARSLNSVVDGMGRPVVGDVPGGSVPNLCPYGRDSIDQTPQLFGGTTIQPIVSAELLAMGFTKGGKDSTESNRPFIGMNYPTTPKIGQWAFYHFYVESDTDNSFGSSQGVYQWYFDGTTASQVFVQAVLVRIISARVREYMVRVRITRADHTYFVVGANTQGQTAYRCTVTGVQFHCSDAAAWWIRRDDYPSVTTTTTGSYDARDAANVGMARRYADRIESGTQRPTAAFNVKFVTGQSLSRGHQTQFALSSAALYGNKMLGGNIWPMADDGATYPVFGGTTNFQDMVPTPEINGTTYTNLTSPDGAFAEPWNCGWLNMGKFLLNQQLMVDSDSRTFVTGNVAVSGKTIEQLSKVNTQDGTNRFARLTDFLDKCKTAAGASTIVVPSVMFGQGEYDYDTSNGSVNATRALYKAKLGTYFDDIRTEVLARFPSQRRGPAFFTYATGAAYTRDVDMNGSPDLHVAMAQLELSLERTDTWMVGPIYPYTDKGGHLTANGSRWYGNMVAKVEHRVQHMGEDWSPVRPTRLELVGNAIYIDFHVPEPPLVWDVSYVVTTAQMYANKGFRVIDLSNGNAAVSCTVELVGKTIVRINLTGSHSNNLAVYYASSNTYSGNGNLRDSDPTVAHDSYVYDAAYMPSSDNIAALVGKPYPLQNWCVPFYYPVGFGV